MAFAVKGPIIAGARETTGVQSVTLTTGYATGDVIVVWAATKATGTSGSSTEVTVTDSKGNSYIRALEHATGATDGTRASVHYANVTAALVSGDTVSLGVNSGLSQFQGMAVGGFTVAAFNKATHIAATGSSPATGGTVISGALAGLAAADYLFLATVANRSSATPPNITGDPTEGWALTGAASTTGTTGGTTVSGQYANWNYKIGTGATGASRNASGLIAGGRKAIVVVALKEESTSTSHQGEATFSGAGGLSALARQNHFVRRPFYSLLLHGDGENNSTVFIDQGNNNHSVTTNADAKVDTSQSKFGNGSIRFDGTGDFLNLDGSDDFAFGGGDFTIDCWARINTTGSAKVIYATDTEAIYVSGTEELIYFAAGSNRIISAASSLTTGTWYHIALTRSGTSTKLFLDGVQQGSTYTDNNNYSIAATRPFIGIGTDLTNAFNGWIDEIRVVKGRAVWAGDFTPPSAAYESPVFFGGAAALSANAIFPSTAHVGAATFNGAGEFSALAQNRKFGEATFAGSGSFSIATLQVHQAAATFAGAGSLSVQYFVGDIQGGLKYWFNGVPFVGLESNFCDTRGLKYWFNGVPARYLLGTEAVAGVHQGQATFNGAGSLSAYATLNAQIAATFAGDGTLSVFPVVRAQIAATFAGAGDLSARVTLNEAAAATFQGAGSLSALAQTYKFAFATFNGAGDLSAYARLNNRAFATFNGAGSISIYANLNMRAFATFAGDGILSVDATHVAAGGQAHAGAATFNGAGDLSAYARLNMRAFATFQGAGSLSAKAEKFIFATFNGAGSLSAYANLNERAFATFQGAGSLSIETQKYKLAAATFQGNSTLSVATIKYKLGAATFNGDSTLSVLARLREAAFATFAGDSTLSAYANLNMRIFATLQGEGIASIFIEAPNVKIALATFNGAGNFSANVTRHNQAAFAIFEGAGSFSVLARLREAAFATLDGLGSLSVNLRQNNRAHATLNGDGTLSARGVLRMQVTARFAGAGDFSVLVTQGNIVVARMAGAGSLQADSDIFVFGTKIGEAVFNGNGTMAANVLQFGPRRARTGTVAYVQGNRSNAAQGGRSNAAVGVRPSNMPRRRTG